MLLIKNAHIKPMVGAEMENGCMLVDGGKIAAIAPEIAAPEGAEVIDAGGRLVTPGCVEAHCHVGLHGQCLRWEGADYNESTDPITPQVRAIDSFDTFDGMLKDGIRGGVTTVCAGPGSANVVGGTFVVTKLVGKRIDKMAIKVNAAMKCAFGENPKSVYGQNKKAPKTRMATAALLRELLFKARIYQQDKDAGKEPKFDMKLEAMLPVMRGEIPLKAHAHRADDILTSIRIAKEFDLKLTLDHCTDGALIADELAEEPYPALVGPSFGNKSKPELKNKGYETAGILQKAGVKVCIITDAPVITIENLPMCAGFAARAGLPMEEAWKAITLYPAQVLEIADRVGSLETGKDADIVIWKDDPLTCIGGDAWMTMVDGKIAYTAE
jgi:imidazolonepropionase-like amidohydrolase